MMKIWIDLLKPWSADLVETALEAQADESRWWPSWHDVRERLPEPKINNALGYDDPLKRVKGSGATLAWSEAVAKAYTEAWRQKNGKHLGKSLVNNMPWAIRQAFIVEEKTEFSITDGPVWSAMDCFDAIMPKSIQDIATEATSEQQDA